MPRENGLDPQEDAGQTIVCVLKHCVYQGCLVVSSFCQLSLVGCFSKRTDCVVCEFFFFFYKVGEGERKTKDEVTTGSR